MESSDVVVVGGSMSGCAAAVLLARQGLRVTVLEQHRDPAYYKRACTHYIQPSATRIFQRLGLVPQLEEVGAVRNSVDLWTRYGWIRPPEDGVYGYSIRRSVLDPLLRSEAAATPGVDLRLGVKATQVVKDGGRVIGVRGTDRSGVEQEFTARLVVGADGRSSPVADWAGVPVKEKKNGRFGYFAYFEDVPLVRGSRSQMWLADPDVAYVFPNDGGVCAVAVLQPTDKLAEFRQDVDGSLRRFFAGLPDAPDLARARRVSDYLGMTHYPDLSRRAGTPGLALIGDAALTTDYLWGVGCGWALESAAWLADEAGPVLATPAATGAEVDRALRRYARRHRRALAGHHFLIADYATGRLLSPLERLLFSAAAHDQRLASNIGRYGGRLISPRQLLSPPNLARSLRVQVATARKVRPTAGIASP